MIYNSNSYNNKQFSFNGYDVIPLRGLYMQGLRSRGENVIYKKMKAIAQKENIDLFLNLDNLSLNGELTKPENFERKLSIWAQDVKAFVMNKKGKTILSSTKEQPKMGGIDLGPLKEFRIDDKNYMPRGGDYYIGYNEKGEKWLLINDISIQGQKSFEKYGDTPTKEYLCELFDVKPKNIFVLKGLNLLDDLDEIVRPIGFPYILVNDYKLAQKNLESMKNKFSKCYDVYCEMTNFLRNKIKEENSLPLIYNCDQICELLEKFGFKPIRIGARYCNDINYINAIAYENKKGGISYITNSTKKSYNELSYLEELFKKELTEKVPQITDTYFVSGGRRTFQEMNSDSADNLYSKGLSKGNVIMDILANRLGGIHCMSAEIPDFDKIAERRLNLIS